MDWSDLVRGAAEGIGQLLVAADLWPVLILATAFGILLVQLTILIFFVDSLSRRLGQMHRDLRVLSMVVERWRKEETIEEMDRHSQRESVAPAAPVSLDAERPDEEQNPDSIVQSADGPVDLQEQLKALREVMLAETPKTDR